MKKLGIILTASSVFAMTSCKDDPSAAFTADKSTAQTGEVVKFTDNSTAAYNHVWDFGDGEWSTAINPTHVYYDEGDFNVTLQVTDEKGETSVFANTTIVVEDFLDELIEGDQEEKDAVALMMTGEWDLDDYTISYNGVPTFETLNNESGIFYADGTILQEDGQGNKSTGYFSPINSEYVSLSFVQGPGGIYNIDELSEDRMTLVNTYRDSSLPSNVTVSTLEFSK